MYSIAQNKHILILFYDNESEGNPVYRPLLQVLNDILDAVPGAPKFTFPEEADPLSPGAWIVAACRCDFVRAPIPNLNHYLPVYPRLQLGDHWEKAVAQVQERTLCCVLFTAMSFYSDLPYDVHFVASIHIHSLV